MSLQTQSTFRLRCDRCGTRSSPALTAQEAEKLARSLGWVRRSGDRDLCAECAAAARGAREVRRG